MALANKALDSLVNRAADKSCMVCIRVTSWDPHCRATWLVDPTTHIGSVSTTLIDHRQENKKAAGNVCRNALYGGPEQTLERAGGDSLATQTFPNNDILCLFVLAAYS